MSVNLQTLGGDFAGTLARIDAAMTKATAEKDIHALVRAMNEVRQWMDAIKAVNGFFSGLYDRVRFSHLPDTMIDTGTKNITVDEVGRCSLTDDVAVTVADKVAFIKWLEEQGLEDMVTESVNAQTLTAFVRKRINESAAKKQPPQLPMELLAIRPYTRATITKT